MPGPLLTTRSRRVPGIFTLEIDLWHGITELDDRRLGHIEDRVDDAAALVAFNQDQRAILMLCPGAHGQSVTIGGGGARNVIGGHLDVPLLGGGGTRLRSGTGDGYRCF